MQRYLAPDPLPGPRVGVFSDPDFCPPGEKKDAAAAAPPPEPVATPRPHLASEVVPG
jgi:hypothetical protein